MAVEVTEEYITDLEDVLKGAELVDSLGIPGAEDLEHIEDVRKELWRYLHNNTAQHSQGHSGKNIIRKILKADKEKKRRLHQLCEESERFIGGLPEARRGDVQRQYPELSTFGDWKHSLIAEECPILVAGETSAGKSSLVNLLFGHDILPVAALSSTSVICELSYGAAREAHVFSRDGAPPIHVPLQDVEVERELSPYVHAKGEERDQEGKYSKVVIHWPYDLLQAGVKIVDSPGVGESDEMTDQVVSYMPHAYGFIYVINAANAGGIQKGRLQDLLFKHVAERRKEGEDTDLDVRSVMFVVNRWDEVAREDREETKGHIIRELKTIWKGIRRSQIFFISVQLASEAASVGHTTRDHAQLLRGVERLLPLSLRSKLEKTYYYMTDVLSNVRVNLRQYMKSTELSDKERVRRCEQVRHKLREIKEKPDKIVRELGQQLTDEVEAMEHELKAYLYTDDVRRELTSWTRAQCPVRDRWSSCVKVIEASIQKRIKDQIDSWERENQKFEQAYHKLIHCFQQNFYDVEEELFGIQNIMLAGEATEGSAAAVPVDESLDVITRFVRSDRVNRFRNNASAKLAMGVAAPVVVPLGVVVGLFLIPGSKILRLIKKQDDKRALKEYLDNRENYMKDATDTAIDVIMKQDVTTMFKVQLEQLMKVCNDLTAAVPKAIKANEDLIDNIQQEIRDNTDNLKSLYKPKQDECWRLMSRFDYLYMRAIRVYETELSSSVDLHRDHLIAEGGFGCIYRANLMLNDKTQGEAPREVALKIMKRPLSENTATEFLVEERNLRRLQCPNIVKYYGTTVRRTDEGDIIPILIMEFCPLSLYDVIIADSEYAAPARAPASLAAHAQRTVARYGSDMSAALVVIHRLGYIHRDLKPENIMVGGSSPDAPLKVADFGVSKPQEDVSGSLVGTNSYIAPEVVANKKYGSSADMFSLGVILWECWFGQRFAFFRPRSSTGERPRVPDFHCHGYRSPPAQWVTLLQKCFSDDPELRPTAEDCVQLFSRAPRTTTV